MIIKRPTNGWNIRRPPVHPGEMLREEFLVPMELSANRLAMELRVPVTRISEIVNGRRGISADTGLRLERYFGMSADFCSTNGYIRSVEANLFLRLCTFLDFGHMKQYGC
jgi:addiction module HigA family antidote